MDVVSRENGLIAGSIAVAIAAWYLIAESTDFGDPVAYGALIVIGVLLPTILLNYWS